MKKLISLVLLVLLSIGICAQDRVAKGNVYNKESHAALEGIEVRVLDTTIHTLTEYAGAFSIDVPNGKRKLYIIGEGYSPKIVHLKPGFQEKPLRIYLQTSETVKRLAKEKTVRDSVLLTHKNAISLSLLELGSVAIAIRYERMLSRKHSVGIHLSSYIYGRSYFGQLSYRLYGNDSKITSTYRGFKAAPFYRFYVKRESSFGVFVDAKIPFGYFYFDKLEYQFGSSYFENVGIEHSFWTYGFGVSAGIMFVLPRSKHVFGNISIGYQYFPVVKGPESISREVSYPSFTRIYHSNYDWWYMPGPGSVIEFKITIGGIF
jgi:hypothetical protein